MQIGYSPSCTHGSKKEKILVQEEEEGPLKASQFGLMSSFSQSHLLQNNQTNQSDEEYDSVKKEDRLLQVLDSSCEINGGKSPQMADSFG